MLGWFVILAAVGLIDGVAALFLGWDAVAPGGDVLGEILGRRRVLGPLAHGRVFIGCHAFAGSVDDEDPLIARFGNHLVHARRHLLDAVDRPLAVVQVPHVTHDDGRFLRIPMLSALHYL